MTLYIQIISPAIYKNFYSLYSNPLVRHKLTILRDKETAPKDFREIAEEVTYIVKGRLNASGKVLKTGDMFVYHPDEVADVMFLEDTDLIVIKWPSVPNDKYNV